MKPIIYIIDDNFVSEFATRIILEQSNIPCTICCFENGALALSGLSKALTKAEQVPTVILLDLNMPGMDGWGFLEGISKFDLTEYDIAIYLVSTFANENTRKKSFAHPLIHGYFERPLSISNIHEILHAPTDMGLSC
jgi:response regulator RpfG family c-di-GMP phosphodiesterase